MTSDTQQFFLVAGQRTTTVKTTPPLINTNNSSSALQLCQKLSTPTYSNYGTVVRRRFHIVVSKTAWVTESVFELPGEGLNPPSYFLDPPNAVPDFV